MKRRGGYGSLLAAAFVLALPFADADPARALDLLSDSTPAKVTVRQIDQFKIGRSDTQFGALTYLGGLELISPDRNVGGLSGLISLDDGGQILAVTDNGLWFSATVDQTPDGKPVGISHARYSEMRDKTGRALRKGSGSDTEALTIDGDTVLVSAERVNTIYRFPWPLKTGNERLIGELALPAEIRSLRGTKGMETLALAPSGSPIAGTLIAIAERGKTGDDDLPGFLITENKVEHFTVVRSDRYDATDGAFLPDGTLLLLERRFNLRDLVGMRLRRFAADSIRPGANLKGDVLMEADYGNQIDNMEGLGIHQDASGRTILTLISDNNRSILQRTLLLRFVLGDG
ncbi:esterase-like activity of phytase family protein [uncultured Roseibium sp.]|uniref:esterase-like activity of phytase family protein n=1 Tax=uncultured Roseibium sp. TaxID=1936171 RepID=UPI0032175881